MNKDEHPKGTIYLEKIMSWWLSQVTTTDFKGKLWSLPSGKCFLKDNVHLMPTRKHQTTILWKPTSPDEDIEVRVE